MNPVAPTPSRLGPWLLGVVAPILVSGLVSALVNGLHAVGVQAGRISVLEAETRAVDQRLTRIEEKLDRLAERGARPAPKAP